MTLRGTTLQNPNLLLSGEALDQFGIPIPGKLHLLQQPTVTTVASVTPLDSSAHAIFSVAADSNGRLFSAGEIATAGSSTAWAVRRSDDGGVTWSTLRTLSLGGSVAQARGVVVTSTGLIAVCGFAFDSSEFSHWIVETSANAGESWVSRDLFQSSRPSTLAGEDLVRAVSITESVGENGGLFVVGSRGNRSLGRWTVMRSRDDGTSWQVVDSWLPSSRGSSRARKATVDTQGRIFVLGDTGSWSDLEPSPWVVRMSADGGGSWRTIFGPWQVGICPVPWDLAVDAFGQVWIAGQVLEQQPTGRKNSYAYYSSATIVRLVESAPSWLSTVHPVSPTCIDANSASAASITADENGHVYVNGTYKEDSSSPIKWFVTRWNP